VALDLRPRRLADGVHLHGERVRHVAVPQQLHARAVAAFDQSGLHQAVGIDHAVGRERPQRFEVDHRVLGLAAEGQEAALGQPAIERHLAALEAAGLAAARAGLVALAALGRRLAVAGARPAADPLAAGDRARRRAQILKPHG